MEYLVWDWPDWTLALVVLGFIKVQPVIVDRAITKHILRYPLIKARDGFGGQRGLR